MGKRRQSQSGNNEGNAQNTHSALIFSILWFLILYIYMPWKIRLKFLPNAYFIFAILGGLLVSYWRFHLVFAAKSEEAWPLGAGIERSLRDEKENTTS